MQFSLIIPTKDRGPILERSLQAIKGARQGVDLQVIIINDSHVPLTLPPDLDFVQVFRNEGKGVASARNYGASLADSEWLIFMDDDMIVQRETFTRLVPFCSTHPGACLNVNWIYPDEARAARSKLPFLRYLQHYGFDSLEGWSKGGAWSNEERFEVEGITSQFLLMHRDTFQKVGGYNTRFPFAGFEDHDFSIRLRKAGIPIYVDPHNMIFHNESDRLQVENWLERKKRGAVTRRVGIALGYEELKVPYGPLKRNIYRLTWALHRPIVWLLHHWPNLTMLDPLYFRGVNLMLGTYACIGYITTDPSIYLKSTPLPSAA